MPRVRGRTLRHSAFLFLALACAAACFTQPKAFAQLEVAPPLLRAVEPPPRDWTSQQLEERADSLRAQKLYLDAIDYYKAAEKSRKTHSAALYNKIGITELQMQRFRDADKDFHRAIKADKKYADGYNNLGVIYYLNKKYGKAVKQYRKAIKLYEQSASYHSNLAAAYFSQKKFETAMVEYARALQLDPEIFERTSQTGVAAQMSSPEDRAHYDYMVAKMYAQMGLADRSLLYLRKAMEEGYRGIDAVYKDSEFAGLRKDPRFLELMKTRPQAIPN
jgi:tetratricopeptide (TPR) repeat protein